MEQPTTELATFTLSTKSSAGCNVRVFARRGMGWQVFAQVEGRGSATAEYAALSEHGVVFSRLIYIPSEETVRNVIRAVEKIDPAAAARMREKCTGEGATFDYSGDINITLTDEEKAIFVEAGKNLFPQIPREAEELLACNECGYIPMTRGEVAEDRMSCVRCGR